MKIRTLLIVLSFSVILCSCFKDLGNYEYDEKEVITVTGIEPAYDVTQLIDVLSITPEITSNKSGAEFYCTYHIYDYVAAGYIPSADTLQSGKKDLSMKLSLDAKTYGLVFIAKNIKTGYSAVVHSVLNVITKFSTGWYVFKNVGDMADLDLTIDENTKIENVLLNVNGRQLRGKVDGITLATNYKCLNPTTGKFVNTRVIFPVTDQDMWPVNTVSAKIDRNYEDMFYNVDRPIKPGRFYASTMGQWTLNNGRAYNLYAIMANTGQFGNQCSRDAKYSPYHLSKYIVQNGMSDPLAYDETSTSFVVIPSYGTQLNAVKDAEGTEMSANECNKKLLYMGARPSNVSFCHAVMQDKTDPSIKFISKITGFSSKKLLIINDTIAPSDPAYRADVFTTIHNAMEVLYFIADNKVYVKNVAAKGTPSVDLGLNLGGATISFIKYLRFQNYLAVGTYSGANYKVSLYTVKTTGDVEPIPALVLDGAGIAGDVIYIYPNSSNTTYTNTY
ncbi:MAG: PKD-like family lipoprotein [Bacteroidales bacterium]|nr:PKD-like family lipoprotein [Bacteroidales bacterium]